jgi:hypothetical protein
MTNDADQQNPISRLWRWIKTPPQVYVAYLLCRNAQSEARHGLRPAAGVRAEELNASTQS